MIGREPVAIMACSKLISPAVPSVVVTVRVWASLNWPCRAHKSIFILSILTAEAAGQLADDLILPVAHPFEIDLWLGEVDADGGRFLGFADQFGDMQQRFGGDAAAVQADTARVDFGIDQGDCKPQFDGPEGRGIAARTGTYDDQLGFCRDRRIGVTHEFILS